MGVGLFPPSSLRLKPSSALHHLLKSLFPPPRPLHLHGFPLPHPPPRHFSSPAVSQNDASASKLGSFLRRLCVADVKSGPEEGSQYGDSILRESHYSSRMMNKRFDANQVGHVPGGRSLLSNLLQGTSATRYAFEAAKTNAFSQQQQRTFIQMRTKLSVVDNSGAKQVMCIQALKGRKGARLGDIIVASVKEARPGGKVKKGDVVRAVVVRAAMPKGRCDGSEVKFDDNACVILNKQGEPVGTRVFGPVPHELRKKKQLKILAMAEHLA